MKLSRVIMLLLAVALLLALAACGKDKAKLAGEEVNFPKWWNSQNDEAYVCTYGMATKKDKGMAMDAADANAMMNASLYVESQVKGMIKNYAEEAGVDNPQNLALTSKVVKVVTDATFSNVITGEQTIYVEGDKEQKRYTAYVQKKIPKTEINKSLYNNIRNEEALYNQFKASQAFQELEFETQK